MHTGKFHSLERRMAEIEDSSILHHKTEVVKACVEKNAFHQFNLELQI